MIGALDRAAATTSGANFPDVSQLPAHPERTSSQASRNLASDRCCDPVCTIRLFAHAASTIFRPSEIVSESGFSQ